jgi:hypothetical protein
VFPDFTAAYTAFIGRIVHVHGIIVASMMEYTAKRTAEGTT